MPVIGLHDSHEQIHPAQLLDDVRHAEQAGFTAATCSDHVAPWNLDQAHSGFAGSWLGAALATTSLPSGAVTAPGQHAAWIAEYAPPGFDEIDLHHVGKEQRGFLDAFGEHFLPQLDVREPAVAS